MNTFFIADLVERLGFELDTIVKGTQNTVKSKLLELNEYDRFPMISYEHTNDSNFDVDISESNFLNNISHSGTWIMGINDDEVIFIVNLKNKNNSVLEIDALEIRDELRGQGLGSDIVSVIESVAGQYYTSICVTPFDTDAENFWKCIGYEEWVNDYLIKKLNYGES